MKPEWCPQEVWQAASMAVVHAPEYTQRLHEDVARALLDAHQRGRREGMEWQPIETAPRDGTNILCFAHGSHGPNDTYYGVAQWAVDGPGKIQPHVEGWFWPFAIRPTHWIPLPEPPAAIRAKALEVTE